MNLFLRGTTKKFFVSVQRPCVFGRFEDLKNLKSILLNPTVLLVSC